MTHPQTQDDEALVEVMARAMQAVSRPDVHPDQLTPGPRGSVQPMKVWQLYEHMARAALTALRNHEGRKSD